MAPDKHPLIQSQDFAKKEQEVIDVAVSLDAIDHVPTLYHVHGYRYLMPGLLYMCMDTRCLSLIAQVVESADIVRSVLSVGMEKALSGVRA